jgi:PAS domain-containing protein
MASQVPPPATVALSLGLALVATSNAPLLLLDRGLTIIAASKSFCRAFQIDPAEVEGCLLSQLGAGEWNKPQLDSMLRATAAGYAEIEGYEIDIEREGRPGRRLVLNA